MSYHRVPRAAALKAQQRVKDIQDEKNAIQCIHQGEIKMYIDEKMNIYGGKATQYYGPPPPLKKPSKNVKNEYIYMVEKLEKCYASPPSKNQLLVWFKFLYHHLFMTV
eukprot:190098_1